MTITNTEIIIGAMLELLEAGLIQPGEEIHTFAKWKEKGYSIKAGEKAIKRFSIWKCIYKTRTDEAGNETEQKKMFLKESCFFASHQVIRNGRA